MPGRVSEEQEPTFASFGYEWNAFDRIEPEDEQFWQRYFADVDRSLLRDAVALDAGCGKGRFSYFTAPLVQSLIAMDGSEAVRAASRNLTGLPNVAVVKGDLLHPPLEPAAFDLIFCLGVLHHLPDPKAGFDQLCRLLRPGGRLLVYVYSRSTAPGLRAGGLKAASWMRRWTVRMPHPVLRIICGPLAALLYLSFVIPGRLGDRLGLRGLARLPLQTYRARPLRSLWLDTFDRLSAPLEARFTWDELEPWFHQHGLQVESVRDDAGWIVNATSVADELPA